MIPLSYFLIAWLMAVAIFALISLFTVMINVRYGLAAFGTYASSAMFLIVAVAVILVTGSYLLTVDWSQTFNVLPSAAPAFGL